MRLTIIREDNFVSIDGVGYHGIDMSSIPDDIHAVQWYDDEGDIEYITIKGVYKTPNKRITSIDEFRAVIYLWESADIEKKKIEVPAPPTALKNSVEAKIRLSDTDFAFMPDVFISNKQEYIEYRQFLRDIILNPVEGVVYWPTKPQPVWID